MKAVFKLLGAGAIAAFCLAQSPADAEVYSQNIVGYYNLPIYAGNNLVANQLDNGSGNSLDTIFQSSIPEGATFTKWDSSSLGYLPLSTYDTNSGWSINYQLGFGEGGLLSSPSTFTNTFVGSVWSGFSDTGPFNPPLISSNGMFLLSCYIPIDPATFHDVVGRDPRDGDFVEILNALTQTETTTTFHDGTWDNGAPELSVGKSAIYGLGTGEASTAPVPEPTVFGLIGAGALVLGILGKRRYNR